MICYSGGKDGPSLVRQRCQAPLDPLHSCLSQPLIYRRKLRYQFKLEVMISVGAYNMCGQDVI